MIVHQVFAVISGEDIKNIIVCDNYELANQLAKLTYGNEAFAEECTQYPVSTGDKFLGKRFVFKDGVTPVPRMNTVEEDAKEAQSKAEALDKQINPVIDIEVCALQELKTWQVNLSKTNLESYLNNNPIRSFCHGNAEKSYSITKEKQSLLTQMILVTQLALQNGAEYQPSWNAAGEQSTYDWTLEELQQLAFEIEAVVRPLVSRQQAMETEISSSETKEAILAVDITF